MVSPPTPEVYVARVACSAQAGLAGGDRARPSPRRQQSPCGCRQRDPRCRCRRWKLLYACTVDQRKGLGFRERPCAVILIENQDAPIRAADLHATRAVAPPHVDGGIAAAKVVVGNGEILHLVTRMVKVVDDSAHGLDGPAHEVFGEVDGMDHVHQDAAAGCGRVVAPGWAVLGSAGMIRYAKEVERDMAHTTDGALPNQTQGELVFRIVEIVVHDAVTQVGGAHGIHHGLAVGRRRGDWLFAENVDAGPGTRFDDGAPDICGVATTT